MAVAISFFGRPATVATWGTQLMDTQLTNKVVPKRIENGKPGKSKNSGLWKHCQTGALQATIAFNKFQANKLTWASDSIRMQTIVWSIMNGNCRGNSDYRLSGANQLVTGNHCSAVIVIACDRNRCPPLHCSHQTIRPASNRIHSDSIMQTYEHTNQISLPTTSGLRIARAVRGKCQPQVNKLVGIPATIVKIWTGGNNHDDNHGKQVIQSKSTWMDGNPNGMETTSFGGGGAENESEHVQVAI